MGGGIPYTNKLRAKITAFARSEGICTRCFCRHSIEGYAQCEPCNTRKMVRGKKYREKFGSTYNHDYYLKHRKEKIAKTKAYKAKRKSKETDIEKAVRKYKEL